MCIWGVVRTRQSCVFIVMFVLAYAYILKPLYNATGNKGASTETRICHSRLLCWTRQCTTNYQSLKESRAFRTFPLLTVMPVCFKIDCYQIKGNDENVAVSFFNFQRLSTCQCCISLHQTCRRHSSTPAWDHWVGVSSFGRQMNLKIWSFPTGFKYKVSFCSILCVQMHFEGKNKTKQSLLLCMRFFLSRNIHDIMTMEDPYPRTSVTINWTSLRQLHLIWPSCLRKAFSPRREPLGVFALVRERKTEEKWPQQHIHVTYEVTLLTNLATNDNTLTSANV